jgi:Fe-S-cluster containining protein
VSAVPAIRAGDHDRFACRSCTACCRSYAIPVGPEEWARILRHDWAREGARFSATLGATLGAGDGGGTPATGALDGARRDPGARPEARVDAARPLRPLPRREDGACVFLDDDGLCLVQKRLGPEAKPDLCRMFPLALVRAEDGALDATVVPECESWHETFECGAPLASGRDVPSPPPPRLVVIAPPALPLRPGGPFLLWADVRALVRRLGARLAGAPSLEEAIAGFGPLLDAAGASAGRSIVRARGRREEPEAEKPSEAFLSPESGPARVASDRDARAAPAGEEARARSADAARIAVIDLLARAFEEGAAASDPGPPEPASGPAALPAEEADGSVRARALAAAAASLRPPDAWRASLRSLPPPTARYLAAVLRAWIEGPTLAQARCEVEAVVGLLVTFARIAAVRARTTGAPREADSQPQGAEPSSAPPLSAEAVRRAQGAEPPSSAVPSAEAALRAQSAASPSPAAPSPSALGRAAKELSLVLRDPAVAALVRAGAEALRVVGRGEA